MKRGLLREYAFLFSWMMRINDLLLLAGAAYLAHWARFRSLELSDRYVMLVALATLLAAIFFSQLTVYESWRGTAPGAEARTLTMSLGLVYLALFAFLVATKTSSYYSRQWLGLWLVLTWALLVLFRLGLRSLLSYLRRQGANSRAIFLVGPYAQCRQVAERVEGAPGIGFRVLGYFDDEPEPNPEPAPPPPPLPPLRRLGALAQLAELVTRTQPDQVWLTLPLSAEHHMREILFALRHSTVDIRYVPDIFGIHLLNQSVAEVAGLPVINLSDTPMHGSKRLVKAVEDKLLALSILTLVSPLMLVIALLIKLTSKGPVLFTQLRHGFDGQVIRLHKFRTMHLHREAPGKVTQATRSDPRITRLGSFLRRTSLDELPQFFNVLKGEMAVVGPRPHAIEHNEQFKERIERYMLRHRVKPGITGWAQVNGLRGETDTLEKMKKRVELDLYYIENWSVWFDLRIVLLTIARAWANPNAY